MPLIRVSRNATSCPRASCQESKTFSCYKSGGRVVSGHIRQRNLGELPGPQCLLLSYPTWAHSWLGSLLPPSTVVCGSKADIRDILDSLPSLFPCYCPNIPGHPQASTFPELSIYLVFSLCSRSNCHYIKKNTRGQSSCLTR